MAGAVDLNDLDMWALGVPYGEFTRLRREAPVAWVDEGPTLKRFRPRAQGRGYRVLKRTSHITVIVSDDSEGGTR